MANPNPLPLSDAARARGRETQRTNREARRQLLDVELDRRGAVVKALDALEVAAACGEPGPMVSAAKELLHQAVGRPAQVVQGDPDRPVRIVVESIARRVRDEL